MQRCNYARPLGAVIIQAVVMAAALLAAAPPNATAAERRFCAVPVLDGSPTQADNGDAWRITSIAFSIPGLPGPVFTPIYRKGQWTIDSDHRLVPLSLPAAVDQSAAIIDWPQAGVSLIETVDGFYAFDADLSAYKVEGGEVIARVLHRGATVNPATGEMVLTGRRGLFVVIDTASSGDDACREVRAPGD